MSRREYHCAACGFACETALAYYYHRVNFCGCVSGLDKSAEREAMLAEAWGIRTSVVRDAVRADGDGITRDEVEDFVTGELVWIDSADYFHKVFGSSEDGG